MLTNVCSGGDDLECLGFSWIDGEMGRGCVASFMTGS